MKIYIDPGHGGSDPGAVLRQNGSVVRRESDDNLRFGLAFRNRLNELGFTTRMSRTTDIFVSLADRFNDANSWGADLYVSIHRNGVTDRTANGFETWTIRNFTAAIDRIAQAIQRRVVSASGFRNRGVKRGTPQGGDFAVLAGARMPAIMPEYGFVTNIADNTRFDRNFTAMIEATAQAVVDVYGLPANAPTPQNPAPPNPPPSAGITYTIRKGDTLSAIARNHGITLAALKAANPQISNPDLIIPGWRIIIPGAGAAPVPAPTIGVGSRVRVNRGSRTWTGGGIAGFVFDDVWVVSEIRGDRVVIDRNASGTNAIMTAVHRRDLTVVT